MNSLSYQKTLDIVEKFMIDSGIREYCTKICKDHCCASCYKENPNACHPDEGRRLPCSIYLCPEIYNVLSRLNRGKLERVSKCIIQQYILFNDLLLCRRNIYYTAPPKIFFEIVRFSTDVKTELEQINTKTIKIRINELAEKRKKGK
jgi:hypothetical protein